MCTVPRKKPVSHVYSDAIQRLTLKHKDARFEILESKLKQGKLSDAELEEYKSLLTR